jgi:uncharacterized membrane protein
MNQRLSLAGAMGLGAGLMYLFDPDKGRRRRALVRDQIISALSGIDDCVNATAKDILYRLEGIAAEARACFRAEEVPDGLLFQRVRSKLGRVVSHPHAVHVSVQSGRIILGGPILKREVDALLDCITAMRGVREIDNRLDVHEQAGSIPALQGGRGRPGERFNLMEANWAPATRLLAGAVGAGLMANCLARRTPAATLPGTAGFALLMRSLTNTDFGRLFGLTGGRGVVEVHKTITIRAPLEDVFRLFAHYETFPRVMSAVQEVRKLEGDRSYWIAKGPGGVPLTWTAQIARYVPHQIIAWRSEPGSVIANAGTIRFDPAEDGGTRVDLCLSYTPPAGLLGHFAARLFGADPKALMDDDLVRLKGLIEEGKTRTPEHGRVARQEVAAATARSAF